MSDTLTLILIVLVGGLVVIVIGSVFVNIYKIFEAIVNYFFRDYINRNLWFVKINPSYKAILQQFSVYYNSLSADEKILFERRVQKFINLKRFIPRGTLKKVTDEMKALIAACAVQLTFGYPGVYFTHFRRILVYEDDYYSTITRKYHQGEVNTRGYIVLSWRNFVRGYSHSTDGRNLGLHEMAHALMLENSFHNYEYDFLDYDAIKLFDKRAKEEIFRIRNGEPSFFRSYAGTNMHEFFAIAVENFFEKTRELHDYDINFYDLMCRLLMQDPLQRQVRLQEEKV